MRSRGNLQGQAFRAVTGLGSGSPEGNLPIRSIPPDRIIGNIMEPIFREVRFMAVLYH